MASEKTNWKGKVVVVTGGAMGIGAATAKLFGESGANVVVMDPSDAAADTVAQIKAKGTDALHVRGDVSAEADIDALKKATLERFGRIDGLVNNAGIMYRHERVEDWPMDEVRKVLNVNLLALFLTTYKLGPVMGQGGGGAIVNISSVGGISAVAYSPVYAAAKAGVLGLTRSVAPSLAAIGVRVNAMLPNFVDTPMTADSPSRKFLPMLDPIDIGRGILHIASDPSLQGAFFTVSRDDAGKRTLSRVSDSPSFTPAEDTPF